MLEDGGSHGGAGAQSAPADAPGARPTEDVWSRCDRMYRTECAMFWAHLSRLTNFLVILNISLFFATGLIKMGYYYTIYSVIFLSVPALGMLVPTPLVRKLWYYLVFVLADLIALYFLVVSIIYWVKMSS